MLTLNMFFCRQSIGVWLVLLMLAGSVWADSRPLKERPVSELEQRIGEIDARLATLSYFTLRGGVGAIGYRSLGRTKSDVPLSVSVAWDKPRKIDEIILVPVIRREEVNHYGANGFPVSFSVHCGTTDPGNKRLLAEFSQDDQLLPRIAPVVIPVNGIQASWIRIDASQLSAEALGNSYIFKLAEIMVFSGGRNIALHGQVTPADDRPTTRSWHHNNLVDGFVPYLMDAASGDSSPPVISRMGDGNPATITIDLGDVYAIDRVHLHAPLIGDTLPYMFDSRFAIPRGLLIEGALHPDFSDRKKLTLFKQSSPFDTSTIIPINIQPTECRYVRLVARNPYYSSRAEDPSRTRFGFSEIELFSGDENVARGKPASVNFAVDYNVGSTEPLTDGRNLYGNILPIRDWLNELALRHALEKERPLVAAELNRKYARQKLQLAWAIRLAIFLGIAIVFGIFIEWIIRQRAIHKTRERIAADIHDELGANLHAIGLLGNLARILKDKPDEQDDILIRLQAMAKRTGLAARYCTNTLEAKELYEDIVEDMRRTTERLVADFEHELTFEGEEFLRQLKLRRRIDLFLFYKECLINIVRHAEASSISARVTMTTKQLKITITDNGHGTDGIVPQSLRRRARLLGAKMDVATPEGGGTRIELRRPIKPRDLIKGGVV